MMRDKKSALFIAAALVFALLLIRLFQLQVVEGGRYRQIAEDNTAKTILAPAARGVIYDRNGKVLVENQPVFMVQVLPSILS
ncbi:MAG: penicillin-binding protein 2, partial [Candidatus Margulisbacteria bacterium]|nr:penicillin-binding protein 2 [Candidatus Margulisiibacteriota bacterium]